MKPIETLRPRCEFKAWWGTRCLATATSSARHPKLGEIAACERHARYLRLADA